jgi:hypothetical protein
MRDNLLIVRKVRARELLEQLCGCCVVSKGCLYFRSKNTELVTHAAGGDVCAPSISARLPADALVSRSSLALRFGSIRPILRLVRNPQVGLAAVEGVTISMIDMNTGTNA